MKFIQYLLVVAIVSLCVPSLQAQKLKTKKDSISYIAGMNAANDLRAQGFTDLDEKAFAKAFSDVMSKKEPQIDPVTAKLMFKNAVRAQKEKLNAQIINDGKEFLAKKAATPGVKALSDGILYEVLQAGDGPMPKKGGDVTIMYEGRLMDGTVFDSSIERGTPNTFNLKRLIKGWQVALPNMKVGEKWRIYIPYDMAYGERGAGKLIKPYSTLVFDIELLGLGK